MPADPSDAPRVLALVVNYNGGDHVVRCVEHLTRTEWPAGAFDIVVVDNASVDGSGDVIETRFPDVEVVRTPVNVGFAGGNNVVLRELGRARDADVVALVNNDAFVEPGWLEPLVRELEAADVGAANAKLVFAPRFLPLDLETDAYVPGDSGARSLGVKILDVECEGGDAWDATEFGAGFHGLEQSVDEPHGRWTSSQATLLVALPDDQEPPVTVRLRVAGDRVKPLKLSWPTGGAGVQVGPETQWVEVRIGGTPRDVINNAGNQLVDGGYGADRGFRQVDDGQFERAEDVFAWCGAAVAIKREYLDDVGLFDEGFFLYYEDFDLAWRGRLLGWRYRYVPRSVVRHMHATTTEEWSPLFDHYVQRNRLLTLTKNAPASFALRQVGDYLRELATIARREVLTPLLRLRRPTPDFTRRRLRSLAAFFRHLPKTVWARRRLERRRRVERDELLRQWTAPRP